MENNNLNNESVNRDQQKVPGTEVAFIHKKTEKLVTAIYMLSNFFPHQEPVKWKVRELGLNLLSDISNVFYSSIHDSRNTSNECIHSINEIINLLDLARVSNSISQMNFSILRDELMSLRQLIEANNKRGAFDSIIMASDFFISDRKFLLQNSDTPNTPKGPIGQMIENVQEEVVSREVIEKTASVIDRATEKTPTHIKEAQKNKQPISSIQKSKPKRSSDEPKNSHKKNDRAETILKLLSKTDNLNVKDIAQVISGCSEKTIQRELLSLVSQNVLKKVGERRWSRYSLA